MPELIQRLLHNVGINGQAGACVRRTAADRAKYCKRRRRKLIKLMGGECSICHEDDPNVMEFHHTGTRTWVARKTARWMRIYYYELEFLAGELQLVCAYCNKTIGRPAPQSGEQSEDIPW